MFKEKDSNPVQMLKVGKNMFSKLNVYLVKTSMEKTPTTDYVKIWL